MLLAFLLATYSLSFRGGSIADLTAAVLRDTKVPIVTPADIDNLPSFYMEYDKPEEVTEFLCRKLSLEQVKGVKNAFAPTVLPSSYLENYSPFMPSPDLALVADSKPCIEQKDGKWRLMPSSNGYFRLDYLESLKMSKPIKVHWLVKMMFVSGQTDWISEKELLQTLAASSFGTLVESDRRYEIDLDPARFRKAAVNWAKSFARQSQDRRYYSYKDELKWTVTAEAFNLCTDVQIKSILLNPNTEFSLAILPGTMADRLANEILRAQFYPKPGENAPINPISIDFFQFDKTKPRQISFQPRRACSVCYPYKDNGMLSL